MSSKLPMIVAAALAVALTQAPDAHADVKSEIEQQMHEDMYRLNEQQLEVLQEYQQCRKMLAKANKKLKKTDKLKSYNYEKHPKGVKVGDDWTITVADIPWVCDAIDLLMARGTLFTSLQSARNYQQTLAADPELNSDPNVRIRAGDYYLTESKTCAAAVAKEVASGATAITYKGESIATAEAEDLCIVLRKWGEYMNESGKANLEKVAPKYRELGVDGDRLELFVEYESVYFRGKKCEIIDDTKKLAKAKYVYQWLENSDGTHTIRKYTFKGNKYKVSEKTYATEKKAYKGCK